MVEHSESEHEPGIAMLVVIPEDINDAIMRVAEHSICSDLIGEIASRWDHDVREIMIDEKLGHAIIAAAGDKPPRKYGRAEKVVINYLAAVIARFVAGILADA